MRSRFLLSLPLAGAVASAFAQDPAAAGKQVYQACIACHSTVAGGTGSGPTLFGVVGRTSGSVPGFLYSRAMKNAKITWTQQTLDSYAANPQQVVPGNHMPYSGMPDAAQRTQLIAYLETLK
jgi:cytochrome c